MRKVSYAKKFEKDFNKQKKNMSFKDLETFFYVVNKLKCSETLEPKYRDHLLSGNYADFRECHIKPDLLLIYTVDENYNELILTRLSSHSELF